MKTEIQLKQYQDDFVFSKAKYPGMESAWATGKSLCLISRAEIYSRWIPDNLGVIFRKEYTDLRDSTCKDFEKYTGLKIDSHREARYKNGSQVLFRHLEELNNIQNMNLGWFAIEQAEELESDTEFFILLGRLRRQVKPSVEFKNHRLPYRSGFIIANAGSDWIPRVFENKADRDYALITATTYDNADVLPEDYLKSLEKIKKERPEIYNRFVLNQRDVGVNDFFVIKQREYGALEGFILDKPIKKLLLTGDPSLGGDECVAYIINEAGRKIDELFLHERDEMKIAGHWVALANKHKVRDFAIDVIGFKGIADRIRELIPGCNMIECCGSGEANDSESYLNQRAEIYWYVSQEIIDHRVEYFDDEIMRKQLVNIKYKPINSRKIKIESKDDIKKRIKCSPDRADAYVQGIWALQRAKPTREWSAKQDSYSIDSGELSFNPMVV